MKMLRRRSLFPTRSRNPNYVTVGTENEKNQIGDLVERLNGQLEGDEGHETRALSRDGGTAVEK